MHAKKWRVCSSCPIRDNYVLFCIETPETLLWDVPSSSSSDSAAFAGAALAGDFAGVFFGGGASSSDSSVGSLTKHIILHPIPIIF